MQTPIQHIYRPPYQNGGLLYAWFLSMHTRVDMVLCSQKTETELLQIVQCIHDTLYNLEEIANYYNPTSELASINRTATMFPVRISRELYEMVALCLDYHEKTMGCFDVTVHSEPYNQSTIRSIVLSPEEQTILYHQKGTTINLSGFLKGYALDKIKKWLITHGIENALVNMGNSSVLALGNHPVGEGWKIDFGNKSGADRSSYSQGILLHNECLTTSGNHSLERKHIISPQSGRLVEGLRQTAVVTDNGIIGEVLSTSLFVAALQQREILIATFHPRMIIDL